MMLIIDTCLLNAFRQELEECECSRLTIDKYLRDVKYLMEFCEGRITGKAQLLEFKEHLKKKRYAVTSVNSMLAAINRFLSFSGYDEWKVRYLKVQRMLFVHGNKELKHSEYLRMVEEAGKNSDKRMALLLQTICATGIRVSELQAITVESIQCGQARICLKGKYRLILIPKSICKELKRYCKARNIRSGSVFVTKNGNPLDRSNIWKMMKRIARKANVQLQKVFPHNFRHLFACTYYEKYRDIVRLADILGHSSIDTTRIYTKRDTQEQALQIEKLRLIKIECTT